MYRGSFKMVKDELVQRSPVRVFEKSIRGGLKAGEIGIIAAPSGIGKTSVLVQIALDKLLQGRKVIHISYTKHTDYVLAWYEDIFDEFVKKKKLENPEDVKSEAVKNRVLLKFSQEGVSEDQIHRSLKALIRDGGFDADAVIVDGFDFSSCGQGRLARVRELARELSISVWYSCTVKGADAYDKQGIPVILRDALSSIDVIIALAPRPDHIDLIIRKDRDQFNAGQLALKLDPKTLLILEG
jgi:hypothetical protein